MPALRAFLRKLPDEPQPLSGRPPYGLSMRNQMESRNWMPALRAYLEISTTLELWTR